MTDHHPPPPIPGVETTARPTPGSAVNHPQYYGGDDVYEVIKIIEAHKLGFHVGNAVKYLLRAGRKDPQRELEDLKKAQWYVERRIKQLELGVDVVPVGS